jgi:hypothetical protein
MIDTSRIKTHRSGVLTCGKTSLGPRSPIGYSFVALGKKSHRKVRSALLIRMGLWIGKACDVGCGAET